MNTEEHVVGAGVIGLGVGRAHVIGLMESKYARMLAVCDLMEDRLAQAREYFKTDTYSDIDEFLAREDIDLVVVATPDHTHREVALAVIDAGKHLLLEKPVALDIPSAVDIVSAAKQKDVKLCVGYEYRLNPVTVRTKELIEQGVLGTIAGMSLQHFRGPFMRDKWEQWIQKKKYSGGMIVEETCHWFDLLRHYKGMEMTRVNCVKNDWVFDDFDFEDLAFAHGTFEDGSIWEVSHVLTGFDFDLTIIINGTKGTLWSSVKDKERSSLDNYVTEHMGVLAYRAHGRPPEETVVEVFGPEIHEVRNIADFAGYFAQVVAEDLPVPVTGEDGIAALNIALCASMSADEGRVVDIPQMDF